MLLDLTRRPIMVLAELCPQSLVVRTFQTKDVSGHVQVKYELDNRRPILTYPKEILNYLPPGASLKRGPVTCHETRIDLQSAILAYERANRPKFPVQVGKETAKLDLAAEPFEVATGAKDAVTDYLFSWRLAIFVQRHKDLWLVTVRDISGQLMQDLCTVATRTLEISPKYPDELPLQRLVKNVAGVPQTSWQHILDDD